MNPKKLYSGEVLDHRDGGLLNGRLHIHTFGERGAGNAHSNYRIIVHDNEIKRLLCTFDFQSGNPAERVNGISNEALLAIVIDRLRDFQSGPFAHEDNARAAAYLSVALDALQKRTLERQARGVEGVATA